MTATESDEPRALVVAAPHNAMDVADEDVKRTAALLISHKGVGIFPDTMTPQQAGQIARLACAYGLDPFAGELILYQGRPYLTIEGRTRLANTHKAFDGMECVPATEAERAAFRCRDDEHLWKATVWRKDRRVPAVAFGRASSGDGNPVSGKWPQEMAQKRAKHRALRDAFSIPLPGLEEAGREDEAWAPSEWTPTVVDAELTTTPEVAGVTSSIRPDQVTAIHTIVHKLGWSDEDYRAMLDHTYQVTTSKALLEGQASSVVEMLQTLEREQTADAYIARIRAVVAGRTWRDVMPSDLYESEPRREVQPPLVEVEMPSADHRAAYDNTLTLAHALDIDLADYVVDERTTRDELLKLSTRLGAEIARETAQRSGRAS